MLRRPFWITVCFMGLIANAHNVQAQTTCNCAGNTCTIAGDGASLDLDTDGCGGDGFVAGDDILFNCAAGGCTLQIDANVTLGSITTGGNNDNTIDCNSQTLTMSINDGKDINITNTYPLVWANCGSATISILGDTDIDNDNNAAVDWSAADQPAWSIPDTDGNTLLWDDANANTLTLRQLTFLATGTNVNEFSYDNPAVITTFTPGDGVNRFIAAADDKTLQITNDVTVPANGEINFQGNAGDDDIIQMGGGGAGVINLAAGAELSIDTSGVDIQGEVEADGTATLDIDDNAEISLLDGNSNLLTINIAAASRLILNNATLTGATTTFVSAGATSILEFDQGSATNLVVSTNAARIDIDGNTTFTAFDNGDQAVTFNIDNGRVLTLTSAALGTAKTIFDAQGTTAEIEIDAASETIFEIETASNGAILDIDNSMTITTLDINNATTIDIDGNTTDKVLTVSAAEFSAAVTLESNGAGGTLLLSSGTHTLGALDVTAANTVEIDVDDDSITIAQLDVPATASLTLDLQGNTTTTITNSSANWGGTVIAQGGGVGTTTLEIDALGGTNTIADLDVTGGLTLDWDENGNLNITDLSLTSGEDLTIDVAANDGNTVAVANGSAFTLAGDSVLELISNAGATDDILSFTNGLSLTGTSQLKFTNDSGRVNGGVTAGASGVTVDVNGSAEIATLTPTNSMTLDVAAGKSLTIDNAVTVPASSIVTFQGTNDASAETLTLTGGMSLGGAAAELNVTGDTTTDMAVAGALTFGADSVILDLDAHTDLTTLTPTNSGTIEMADGIELEVTNAISIPDSETLTITATAGSSAETLDLTTDDLTLGGGTSGQLSIGGDTADAFVVENGGINPAAGSTLDLNIDATIDDVTLSGSATLAVATGEVLTATNGVVVGTSTLTLSETGTISLLTGGDGGQVTCNANVTISDFRPTPGAGNTFTWAGTGSATVTMDNATALSGDANTFNKLGTGTLTISDGLSQLFDNAAGVIIDIDAGTLVVGSSGGSTTIRNITMDDDADAIQVASGATLTTYGDIVVGADGATVNLDAVAGSTVNLSSVQTTQNITGTRANDLKFLGTTNVNGSSQYVITNAHEYRFGDLNISGGCELNYEQASGAVKFTPGSTATISASGTLVLAGTGSSTMTTVDTTSGSGAFTIYRGASGDLTLSYCTVSNAVYSSATGQSADCENISILTGTTFTSSNNSNWEEPCTSSTLPPPDDDPESDEEQETIDSDGDAQVNLEAGNKSASVELSGVLEGTQVTVQLVEDNTIGTYAGMGGGEGSGNGIAAILTVTSSSSSSDNFQATLQICASQGDLDDAGLTADQLAMYVYDEEELVWVIAGTRNQGLTDPTGVVGDFGTDPDTLCAWVVVDHLSSYAVGQVTTYSVSATAENETFGSVSIDPELAEYNAGSSVTVTATPATGYQFVQWLGDVPSSQNPLTFNVNDDTSVVAIFAEEEVIYYTLTTEVIPVGGGTIELDPNQSVLEEGASVELLAVPEAGYVFVGWYGDVDSIINPLTLTMDGDYDIGAEFELEELPPPGNQNENDNTSVNENENGVDNQNMNENGEDNINENGDDQVPTEMCGLSCGATGSLTIMLILIGLVGMKKRRLLRR